MKWNLLFLENKCFKETHSCLNISEKGGGKSQVQPLAHMLTLNSAYWSSTSPSEYNIFSLNKQNVSIFHGPWNIFKLRNWRDIQKALFLNI